MGIIYKLQRRSATRHSSTIIRRASIVPLFVLKIVKPAIWVFAENASKAMVSIFKIFVSRFVAMARFMEPNNAMMVTLTRLMVAMVACLIASKIVNFVQEESVLGVCEDTSSIFSRSFVKNRSCALSKFIIHFIQHMMILLLAWR